MLTYQPARPTARNASALEQISALDVKMENSYSTMAAYRHAQRPFRIQTVTTTSARGRYTRRTTPVTTVPTTNRQEPRTPLAARRVIQVSSIAHQAAIGYSCTNRAATSTTTMCQPGFYCNSHSPFAQPNPALTSQVDSSFYQASQGGYCGPGQYCPQGTPQPAQCDAGFYCPTYLMNELNTGLPCNSGFYCTGSAQTATPQDGTTGNICPAGSYCPSGSVSPMNCPPGTFLSYTGATDANMCQACLPGQYCGTSGLSSPTGNCAAGFYCPAGTSVSSPVETICPPGYICPAGSKTPQLCPNGKYTNGPGQTACADCPVGSYCTPSVSTGIPCDQGSYCPGANLKIYCPTGTYNSLTGSNALGACLSCDAGFACPQPGLTAQTTKCNIGYICTGGAITPQPGSSSEGGRMCVKGEYCPQGSSTPTPCTAGKYCKDYASGTTTAMCEGGYYCPGGASTKNPLTFICPPGSYCPSGSSAPTPCPVGTFSPSLGASAVSDCQPCPAGNACESTGLSDTLVDCAPGYYCPGGASAVDNLQYLCLQGYQCPGGTQYQKICLPGTNQPLRGQTSCDACPAVSSSPCLIIQGLLLRRQYPCNECQLPHGLLLSRWHQVRTAVSLPSWNLQQQAERHINQLVPSHSGRVLQQRLGYRLARELHRVSSILSESSQ